MEVASSSLAWSHRPEPDLIGVSVFQRQNQFSLRFHLRSTDLERINNPKNSGHSRFGTEWFYPNTR